MTGYVRRVLCALSTAGTLLLTLTPSPASAAVVFVPGGTEIPIHVMGSISSGSAHIGDTFTVQALHDVVIDDMIVVREGAEGEGTIIADERARGSGHSGSMALNFNWIYSVDGGKIRLSSSAQHQREDDRKGAASTMAIIGYASFGLAGLFAHNFVHGRDVTIDDSKALSAFVIDSVHVHAHQHPVAGPGEHYDR